MSKIDYSSWPPREWRAFLALIASVFGSVALTFFAAAIVYILWKGGWPDSTAEMRIEMLGRALTISLGGSLLVLITLGMAINRRSIKVSSDGFEAIGGDDFMVSTDAVSAADVVDDASEDTTSSDQETPEDQDASK